MARTEPVTETLRGVARWLALLTAACLAPLPVAAQLESAIPQSLREGWGFADDIRDFGDSLAGGYELSERDVDCDGQPEVLLERLARRRGSGSRSYALFDSTPGGYRYLGEAGAIWAVVDYGSSGGCYLATYAQAGGAALTLRLALVADGALEPLGRLELEAGDDGSDDDNALLSAIRTGGLEEERLMRLAAVSRLRPITLEPFPPLAWVESSRVEEVVESVEGYGPRVFERVRPERVGRAGASPWWSGVSGRAARQWAGAVEAALTAGELGRDRPEWLPPPGSGGLEILASRVADAVRLNLPMGRPPVGVAIGSFDAELLTAPEEPPRRVEIPWAALVATTRLGEPEGVVRLFLGIGEDGRTRSVFRLERLSNFDHDREPEVVIEERTDAGRVQWVLDLTSRGEVEARRLEAGSRPTLE